LLIICETPSVNLMIFLLTINKNQLKRTVI